MGDLGPSQKATNTALLSDMNERTQTTSTNHYPGIRKDPARQSRTGHNTGHDQDSENGSNRHAVTTLGGTLNLDEIGKSNIDCPSKH